jgi:hypothetical protein
MGLYPRLPIFIIILHRQSLWRGINPTLSLLGTECAGVARVFAAWKRCLRAGKAAREQATKRQESGEETRAWKSACHADRDSDYLFFRYVTLRPQGTGPGLTGEGSREKATAWEQATTGPEALPLRCKQMHPRIALDSACDEVVPSASDRPLGRPRAHGKPETTAKSRPTKETARL